MQAAKRNCGEPMERPTACGASVTDAALDNRVSGSGRRCNFDRKLQDLDAADYKCSWSNINSAGRLLVWWPLKKQLPFTTQKFCSCCLQIAKCSACFGQLATASMLNGPFAGSGQRASQAMNAAASK